MNKKNEKGFTLVELVVVIALLTVMMGAILQLMGPIRQVYNTTLNTVNTKTAGETIIGYIEDKTRYATDMLVLKNYEGVPQISPIGTSETFKVGACSAPFTECIIVDNNHLRDEMFADFSNDTLTSRKNCRGTVYTLKDLGGKDYLDLTKAKAGSIGNNVYGPYSYHTNIFLEENKFKYDLLVDVESYAMEFQNNAYVEAADPEYTANRKFDLTNINIDKDDSYKVWDFLDFATEANYTKYPQATAPSALSAKLQSFYNTSNKYTYVFYGVKSTNDSVKFTYTFQYDTTDTSFPKAGEILAARPVNAGKYLDAVSVPTPVWPRAGYTGYYYRSGGVNYDKDGIAQIQATEDMVFTIYYNEDTSIVRHNVKFVNADNTDAYTGGRVEEGYHASDPGAPTSGYDPATQSYQWLTSSGGTLDNTEIWSDTVFYANIRNKYKVGFYSDATTLFEPEKYIDGGKKGEAGGPTVPNDVPTAPAGKVFDNWYVDGDPTKPIDNYEVTSDTKFIALYKVKPPSDITATSVITSSTWNCINYQIKLKNNTTSTIKRFKMQLPFKMTGKTPTNYNVNAWQLNNDKSLVGNKLTFTSTDSIYNYLTIGPNGTLDITLTIEFSGSDGIKPEGEQGYTMPASYKLENSDIDITTLIKD